MTLHRRLFVTYLAVCIALVAIAGGLLYDTVSDEARRAIESRLVTEARLLAAELAESSVPRDETALDQHVDRLAVAGDARITIVAPNGRVIADSEFDGVTLAALDNHASRVEVRDALMRGEGRGVRYSRSLDVEMLYRARRIADGPWRGGVARIAVPLTRVRAARSAALGELLVAFGVAMTIAVLAAGLWARRLSRPIHDLLRTADRVVDGDLSARARVATGDELEELAQALNSVTARLSERITAATEERDRLEGILDAMVEGVVVVDADGRIALANAALLDIFGIAGKVEGRTPLETLRHPGGADALAEAARRRVPVTHEFQLRWPEERALALHAVGLPMGGAVGVFHDITERHRLDAVRRDFVANVSHELRTPLTTLAGYAEELHDAALSPEESRRSADIIRRHVVRMTALVEDLLDLARLEADGFTPTLEEIDLPTLLTRTVDEWRDRAQLKGVALDVEAADSPRLEADPRLLRQALTHLLDNAVKYAPAGSSVKVAARGIPGGIELVVADRGPGVPLEDQSRIFERFYRVEKGRSRESGGTGLGLAIVKHIAESHGGWARVESQPGQGAIFSLFLPTGSGSTERAG
jgi:two-component system phosphate regulon sensor histidine kinase PhoR